MTLLRSVLRAAHALTLSSLSAAALLAAGCSSPDAIDRFELLALRAEQVRELPFLREVAIRSMSREQYLADQEAAAAAIDEAELAEFAATYGRLGFFPMDSDLRAIVGASSAWVGAYYDNDPEEIVLLGEVSDEVVVHELVHALQDQHFDLESVQAPAPTRDARLSLRAIVEGDATIAEGRFALQEKYDVDLDRMDWAGVFESRRQWSQAQLAESDLPPIFLAYPSFAYTFGLEYTAFLLVGASASSPEAKRAPPFDWSRENALFTGEAPETTQEVLRLGIQDSIADVGLAEVPAALGNRLSMIDWDSLGEWTSYLLLYGLDGAQGIGDVRALAGAWDGDRALFVRDLDTQAIGVGWASAWDDVEAATRVEAALSALYAAEEVDASEPRLRQAGDGEAVWIERRGDRVVALKNVAPEIMPALAESAFPAGAAPMRHTPRSRRSLAEWLVEHDLVP